MNLGMPVFLASVHMGMMWLAPCPPSLSPCYAQLGGGVAHQKLQAQIYILTGDLWQSSALTPRLRGPTSKGTGGKNCLLNVRSGYATWISPPDP